MKNIVICCDGTGNEFGENNTNVVETYALSKKTNSQIVFYDPGVGTGDWEYSDGPDNGSLKSKMDQATGEGLQNNVNDAYAYLMETYEEGDKLFLFGFSRGAFTVRSLAGMLYKCGLLHPDNDNLIGYAAKLYNTEGNIKIAHEFKKTFSRKCSVHFIGVWDTVSSLVMNAGKKWHNSSLNPEASHGYHAVSIDEKRKDFPPCLWDETDLAPNQTIEQVWFAGVHSDVGAWYPERGLSNIALHWMLTQARRHGLQVNTAELNKREQNPNDELHNSFTGIWKIRGTYKRQIPEGAKIHESVFIRKRRPTNKYKPTNLPANYIVVKT
ncbi:MAG: DUF2235 domain-containing protein [Proteobacteria bacterium]|nr:DUF2235 domain-containing protein [Pseudomonadota bacterium]MDA0927782.1 DUF2235 domain-containing protein [Pseudomonadota bacterium]